MVQLNQLTDAAGRFHEKFNFLELIDFISVIAIIMFFVISIAFILIFRWHYERFMLTHSVLCSVGKIFVEIICSERVVFAVNIIVRHFTSEPDVVPRVVRTAGQHSVELVYRALVVACDSVLRLWEYGYGDIRITR